MLRGPVDKLFFDVYRFSYFYTNEEQMRTNIDLDDHLMQQALQLCKIKTKKDVIHEALKNYVGWMKRKQLLDLKGKVQWEGNLKEMRSI